MKTEISGTFMKIPLCLLVAVLALIACSTAHAADTKTWAGSVNDNWYEAANWEPSGVPASNDTINIGSGSPNAIPPVAIAGTLNWAGGEIFGALTIASNGVMNISGNSEVYLDAALTNAGTVNWNN